MNKDKEKSKSLLSLASGKPKKKILPFVRRKYALQ
jgi:hypothetical protein